MCAVSDAAEVAGPRQRRLIRRWPSRKSGYEVWFTRIVPQAVYEDRKDAAVLSARAVPAGRF